MAHHMLIQQITKTRNKSYLRYLQVKKNRTILGFLNSEHVYNHFCLNEIATQQYVNLYKNMLKIP